MPKYLVVLIIIFGLFFGFQSHAQTFSDGMLIRGSGPEVYVLEHGLKRWITSPGVFSGLFYSWDRIIHVSDSDLANFPPGNKLDNSGNFPDGTLLKSAKNPKVYVSDQGKLRWIPDPDVFNSNNFSWGNIIIVSDNAIENKGKGADAQNGEFLLLPAAFITEKPPAEINLTRVTFSYSGTNPTGPVSELAWETFLDGYDVFWQGPTSNYTRTIDLPGVNKTYIFYVRSRNKDGKVASHPASYSFSTAGFSSSYAQLKINDVRRSGSTETDEYVKVTNYSAASVDITGLKVKNKNNNIFLIPKGSEYLYLVNSDSSKDIILEPNKSAIIFSGSSPAGNNFRLNKCTGYLNYFYNFSPSLPQECPKPTDQDIAALGKNCRDYINALQACATPNTADSKVSFDSQCTSYLTSTFNYSGCVTRYQHDPDFLKNDWYIYLNRSSGFWDDSHDEAKLLDQNNNLIDSYSY